MVDTITSQQVNGTTSSVRLGLYQGKSKIYDVETNLATVKRIATVAKQQYNCDIIIYPELFLHGYELDPKYSHYVKSTAISQQSTEIQSLQQLAQSLQITLCVSYIESVSDSDKIYNSTVLIDYTGKIVANYRKTHLWYKQEQHHFTPGTTLQPVITLQLPHNRTIRTSLAICYDIEFPEVVRTIALQGCELLLVPTAVITADQFTTPMILLRARCVENHIYIAYCNLIGVADLTHLKDALGKQSPNNFLGASGIINPQGAEIARAVCTHSEKDILPEIVMPFDEHGQNRAQTEILNVDDNEESQLLVCDIDPKYWKDKFESVEYLSDRRPELYKL